jgi:hypothetical protein
MNNPTLTQKQCEAVADLLVLAMCIDGHFSLTEEEKITQKISNLGWDPDLSPDHHVHLSIARARDVVDSPEKIRFYVEQRAEILADPHTKNFAYKKAENLLKSDGLKKEEGTFLVQLRAILGV